MKKCVLLILLSYTGVFAQLNEIKTFPYNRVSLTSYTSSVVYFNNNYYAFFYDSTYADSARVAVSKSADGTDWSPPVYLYRNIKNAADSYNCGLTASVFKGRLSLIFKGKDNCVLNTYSANGNDWSSPNDTIFADNSFYSAPFHSYSSSDTLFVSVGLNILLTTSDLLSWEITNLKLPPHSGPFSCIPIDNNTKAVVYCTGTDLYLFLGKYYNGSLQNRTQLLPSGTHTINPKIIKSAEGVYYIVFNIKVKSTLNIEQWDVAYIKSTDNLATWSEPVFITRYPGLDYLASVVPGTSSPVISFFSDRTGFFNGKRKPGIAFAPLSAADPLATMPAVLFSIFSSKQSGNYKVNAVFANLISSDIIFYKQMGIGGRTDSIRMYDDGLHDDSLANDNIWGCTTFIRNGETIDYVVGLKRGNMIDLSSVQRVSRFYSYNSSYLFDVNRLRLTMNEAGNIGFVNLNGVSGGFYDESVILRSAGFLLSCTTKTKRWVNGVDAGDYIVEYVPGNISNSTVLPELFVIKNTDSPFSASWIKWKNAVELGANFLTAMLMVFIHLLI